MHLGSWNFDRSPVNEKENLRSDCIFQNKVCCGKVQEERGSDREKVSFRVCSVAAKTIPTTIMLYQFMSLFSISYEIPATLTCFPRDKRKRLENRCRKRTCVIKHRTILYRKEARIITKRARELCFDFPFGRRGLRDSWFELFREIIALAHFWM